MSSCCCKYNTFCSVAGLMWIIKPRRLCVSWNGSSICIRLYLPSTFLITGHGWEGTLWLAVQLWYTNCEQSGDEQISSSPDWSELANTYSPAPEMLTHTLHLHARWSIQVSAHETGCGLEFLPAALNQVCVCLTQIVFVCCVCRVDSDYYQVSVGAATESGWVLPSVSKPRLQFSPAGHAFWRGHGHEAVGIQREASHVYVSGQFSFGNLHSDLEVSNKTTR